MSKVVPANITCPHCGKSFNMNLYRSIWGEDKKNRELVLSDKINVAHCPFCKTDTKLNFSLLYTNTPKKIAVWWEPEFDPQVEADIEEYKKILPSSHLATASRIRDWDDFKKKIIELESVNNPVIQTTTSVSTVGDNEYKNENTHDNKSLIVIILVVFMACFGRVTARNLVHNLFNSEKPKYYSQESLENISKNVENKTAKIKDAMFTYGYVTVNTQALIDFCKDAGYIPEKYVLKFRTSFLKTMETMEINLKTLDSRTLNGVKEIQNKTLLKILNDDFEMQRKSLKQENIDLTKAAYCKIFDEDADNIVKEKVENFKMLRADLFMD